MVDFELSPRQQELRDLARHFATEVMIPAAEASDRVPEADQSFDWAVSARPRAAVSAPSPSPSSTAATAPTSSPSPSSAKPWPTATWA